VPTVKNTLLDSAGSPASGYVEITLMTPDGDVGGYDASARRTTGVGWRTKFDAQGTWQVALPENSLFSPPGSYYQIAEFIDGAFNARPRTRLYDITVDADPSVQYAMEHRFTPTPPSSGGGSTVTYLDDLANVAVPDPTLGDVLTWNGTQWVATAPDDVGPESYDAIVEADTPVLFLAGVDGVDAGTGNHATATVVNGPLAATTLPNGNAAWVFNGESQYAQIADAADLSAATTGALTIEAWIRPDALDMPHPEDTGYIHFIGKGTPNQYEYSCRMYNLNNDEARPNRISGYAFNLTGGLGVGSYFQDALTAGQWIHYTFVINTAASGGYPTGYTKIYKNGVLRDTDSLSALGIVPENGTAPLRVGMQNIGESYWLGGIGKVAVYNYELSPARIAGHYDAMTVGQVGVAASTFAGLLDVTAGTPKTGDVVAFDAPTAKYKVGSPLLRLPDTTDPAVSPAAALLFGKAGVPHVMSSTGVVWSLAGDNPSLSPHGAILAEPFDSAYVQGASTPVAGRLNLVKMLARASGTATSVLVSLSTAGDALTGAYAAVLDSSGARIARTGDLSTAWDNTGVVPCDLIQPVQITAGQTYYVALLSVAGSTLPAFDRAAAKAAVNAGLAAGAARWSTVGTGLTAIPATVDLTATAVDTASIWAGLATVGGAINEPPETATIIYVDGSAGSPGTGTLEAPFQTIQEALDVVVAGQTILVADGTYQQALITKTAGSQAQPITVKAASLHGAYIRGASNTSGRLFQAAHPWYVLDGLKLGISDKLIYTSARADNWEIKNCWTSESGGESIRLKYGSSNWRIHHNLLERSGRNFYSDTAWTAAPSGSQNGEVVYIGTSPDQLAAGENFDNCANNRVDHNVIRFIGSEAVNVKEGSTGTIVEHNNIDGGWQTTVGSVNLQGEDGIVRYNRITDHAGHGIRLGDSQPTPDGVPRGIRNAAYGNTISGCAAGGVKIEDAPQGDLCGNTFSGNGGSDYGGSAAGSVTTATSCSFTLGSPEWSTAGPAGWVDSGPPPPPPAATTAELLHLAASGGYNHFNLGVGFPSGHTDITPAALYAGYSVEEGNTVYKVNPGGTAVRMRVGVNGGRTSANTSYPRVEFREYNQDNTTKAAWSAGSGVHYLQGHTKIVHLAATKPWVSIAQIHDAGDDIVQILTRKDSGVLRLRAYVDGNTHATYLIDPIAEGDEFDWEIRMDAGVMTIKIDGVTKITSSALSGKTGCYFKAGCYAQSNTSTENGDATQYFEIELSELKQWHTGWPTPVAYP
jgi:hypothetical protein